MAKGVDERKALLRRSFGLEESRLGGVIGIQELRTPSEVSFYAWG